MEAIALSHVLKLMLYIKGAGKMNEYCHFLYYYLETYSKPDRSGLGKVGPYCLDEDAGIFLCV